MWSLCLLILFPAFCQTSIKKLEVGLLRVLPSPSVLQQRITEIEQQKEELNIEVSMSHDLDKNVMSPCKKKLLDKVAEELIGLTCYSSYLIEKIDLELSDQLRNL